MQTVKLRPEDREHFRIVLPGAGLARSNWDGANFVRANLRGTNLHGASLRQVDFRDADLTGADLRGADLTGARNLTSEQLSAALVDEATRLPAEMEQHAAE